MSSGEESLGSASRRKVLAVTSFMSKEAQAMRKKDDMTIPLTGEANGTGKGKVLKTDYRSIGSPNSSDEDDETGLITSISGSGAHCHVKRKGNLVNRSAQKQLLLASLLCVIFMIGEGVGNHCHRKEKNAEVDNKARNKLIIASILCLIFMCGEAVGGALARSLAVVTDAAHLLTDFASFMISLLAIYLASRPATKKMSFGWYRAEVMGALVSVLMIWVVTGILVYMAVLRIINEDYEIDAKIMLITAAVGVMFNIVMGCTLHQHGHTHGGGGHGHSHGGLSATSSNSDLEAGNNSDEAASDISANSKSSKDGQKKRKKEQNINVKAAFIHVIGDFCQSLGVLVAAFIIYFKPEWKIADPICTFLFSVLVLITTINILRDTLHVLMEGAPQGLDFNEVKQSFFEIKGVKEVHNLRMWSLTIDKAALSVHLAIDKKHNSQEVLKQASRMVRHRFNIHDVTLQVEEYCDTMEACDDCKDPTD